MLKSLLRSIQVVSYTFTEELRRIFTDTGAILILLGAAVIYPLAYSVAYQNNVLEEIPIGLVDLDHSNTSYQLVKGINDSEKISIYNSYESLEAAEADLWTGAINGVVLVDKGFETDLLRGEQANVSLYSDAGYFLIYKETLTGVLQSSMSFAAKIEVKKLISKGSSMEQAIGQRQPINAEIIQLYNPSSSYGSYVMPGMLILILQQLLLVGIGMVNGADNERRNNKFVFPGMMKPRGIFSIIIGKSLAYFLISVFTFTFSFVWIYHWFGYPAKASYLELLVLLIPFLFATIFLGLAISILYRKREHSIMLLVFLSPIVLFLSGLSWPVQFMPKPLNVIAQIFPTSNAVPAYLRLRTMGVALSDIRSEWLFLFFQMLVYFFLAAAAYKFAVRRQAKKLG